MEKHRIQQYPVRKGGDCMITAAIPGGNIQLFGISGNRIELDVELRDTTTDWFYWSFKAEFPRPGRYEFYFVKPNRIGPRGPAYSLDNGRSWRWLGENTDGRSFVFDYDGSVPEVLFCMGMAYLERDFEAFRSFSGPPPEIDRFYSDRTPHSNCDHRHSGSHAAAGAQPGA